MSQASKGSHTRLEHSQNRRPRNKAARRARPGAERLEARELLALFVVTDPGDNPTNPQPGSLRYAIQQVNASNDLPNGIQFDIPGSPTIHPLAQLPTITKTVLIDGSNAAGSGHLVEINGAMAGSGAAGLSLGMGSSGSVIENLIIDQFSGSGMDIASSNDLIAGTEIGTHPGGTSASPNGVGIVVESSSSGVTIGGTTAGARNLVSGNAGLGIDIEGASALVEGNYVGTDFLGARSLGNGASGILVNGPSATIGGTAAGSVNVISANGDAGVLLQGGSPLVEGNLVGTDVNGFSPLGNVGDGILVSASNATIGGVTAGAGNLISGNGGNGITVEIPSALVQGNIVGTNLGGFNSIGNGYGIAVDVGGTGATIGGTTPGARNLVSGNTNAGIGLFAPSALVEGNFVGTDVSGRAILSNPTGILVYGTATGATIGGSTAGAGNLVSGNVGAGINLLGPSALVEGNLVGADLNGAMAVANGGDGIIVSGVAATIGGLAAGAGNLISGNNVNGIAVEVPSALVEGNLVGTDITGTSTLGNGFGIGVDVGGTGATIGGTTPGARNLVSGNTNAGIDLFAPSALVEGNFVGTDVSGRAILSNPTGILVNGAATGVTIGGSTAGAGNLVSGNTIAGIDITAASALVEGNLVGTDASGAKALGNFNGIVVEAGGSGATIGGTVDAARNVVSGNGNDGIELKAPAALIQGNFAGVDASGEKALGNFVSGIVVEVGSATIGGTAAGAGNLASGNFGFGVDIEAPSALVEGNKVGTDVRGALPLGNGAAGILVNGSAATIGGTMAGAGNLVSGNFQVGIDITTASALVEGNDVGTDETGAKAVGNNVGIFLFGDAATIGGTMIGAGNLISGNLADGIVLEVSTAQIQGNLVGTDKLGANALGNGTGILIDTGVNGATIGGTAAGAGNLVSGNVQNGIEIGGSSALVVGNEVGTDVTGAAAVGNRKGIKIDAGVTGVTIGGTAAGTGNLVSGNLGAGIDISGDRTLVQGNSVGTDARGTTALANHIGIVTESTGTNATIGGTTAVARNLVSGNFEFGIELLAPSALVEGNYVGTTATGVSPLGNGGVGVFVNGASATIGGTTPGAGNVISANGGRFEDQFGIEILGPSALVEGNSVGTDAKGSKALGNLMDGIFVNGTSATIGGTTPGAGNVFSGNLGYGIDLFAASTLVEGNNVGTNAAGISALGNQSGGILQQASATGATIGGTSSGARNVISGNAGVGINIQSSSAVVMSNDVGADRTGSLNLGNTGAGILVSDSSPQSVVIGGLAEAGNVIAFNGGPGVATTPGSSGATIRFNAIFGNGGPGIDRGNDGVTPNLPGGANNTPVLSPLSGGILTGTLNALANSAYTIDFYASMPLDGSAVRPGGRNVLGSVSVQTDAAGDAVFSFPFTAFPGRSVITATATDAAGSTSEFSPPPGFVVSASGVNFTATVGVPFQGKVANVTTSDPAATASGFSATIDWGDGQTSAGTIVAATAGFVVVGSHTFTTASPAETVTVTVTSLAGPDQGVARSLATVAPNPIATFPVASVPFVAGTSSSRVVATFRDADPKAFAGQFTATINWGDGSAATPASIVPEGSGFDVAGTHTYNQAGTDTITVTIQDAATGLVATASGQAAVAPVPITITPRQFAVTGNKNFSGAVATFADGDPRIDPKFYTATIDWGDGSPVSTGTISGKNPFTVTASHTFPTFQNTHLVTITITDKNGRRATAVDRVVDPPAAPGILSVAAPGVAIPISGRYQGVVASFSDTGPIEPASSYSATISWGKARRAAGMIVGSDGRFTVSANLSLPRFARNFPLTLTVSDGQGRTVSVTELATHPTAPARWFPTQVGRRTGHRLH